MYGSVKGGLDHDLEANIRKDIFCHAVKRTASFACALVRCSNGTQTCLAVVTANRVHNKNDCHMAVRGKTLQQQSKANRQAGCFYVMQ